MVSFSVNFSLFLMLTINNSLVHETTQAACTITNVAGRVNIRLSKGVKKYRFLLKRTLFYFVNIE